MIIGYSAEKDQSKIDEIQKYLNSGIELPDEFPVREETLYDLANVEAMKGNKARADSLRDELVKKYPKGKFTEKFIESRAILAQMENKPKIEETTTLSEHNNSIKIVVISGLSVIAIGMVIFIGKVKKT